ncbi:MAG TPA: hypothetical protein VM534_05810 [Thermoanaerobaculia bacterium]|nr:hypothetical protein [Thermoanaerobaculia bacterium]
MVWENWFSPYPQSTAIYGTMIEEDRGLREPAIEIGHGVSPAVVWDGRRNVIVYGIPGSRFGEIDPTPDLGVIALDSSGRRVAETSYPFRSSCHANDGVEIVFTGTEYLIAWSGCESVRTIVLGPDLSPSTAGDAIAGGSRSSLVLAGGRPWLSWIDPDGDVILSRLDAEGKAVAPVTLAKGASILLTASSGDQILLVYRSEGSLHSLLFDTGQQSAGSVIDLAISGDASSLITLNDGFLLLSSIESDIQAAHLDSEGRLIDVRRLTSDPARQYDPSVISNNGRVTLAWSDDTTGGDRILNGDIFIHTFDTEHPEPFVPDESMLASWALVGGQRGPLVVENGSEFLVFWNQYVPEDQVFAAFSRRLSAGGDFLSPPQRLPFTGDEMQAALNGRDLFVVWQEGIGPASLRGMLVGADGKPKGGIVDVGGGSRPRIASDGDGFFAVWDAGYPLDPTEVRGTRITAGGTVEVPGGYTVLPGSPPHGQPAIAWNGAHYLVAWRQPWTADHDLLIGVRVSPGGTALGVELLSNEISVKRWPALAWNGEHFLLAWERQAGCCEHEIRARLLSASGEPIDDPYGPGTAVAVSASGGSDFRKPRVVAAGNFWFAAYSGRGRFLTRDGTPIGSSSTAGLLIGEEIAALGTRVIGVDTSVVPERDPVAGVVYEVRFRIVEPRSRSVRR